MTYCKTEVVPEPIPAPVHSVLCMLPSALSSLLDIADVMLMEREKVLESFLTPSIPAACALCGRCGFITFWDN